jgi:hypothetical protein
MVHIDNLEVLLRRQAAHAPNHTPNDGLVYRTIHKEEVQAKRHEKAISCGPGGVLHDYVPFYFGYCGVMLLNLATGRVAGYSEGQDPLIYLISRVEDVVADGLQCVFTDGHSLASYTSFFDDTAKLSEVDWELVNEHYWASTPEDPDRQRRKQAEFLVYREFPWSLVRGLVVRTDAVKAQVEGIFSKYPAELHRPVAVRPGWYYDIPVVAP